MRKVKTKTSFDRLFEKTVIQTELFGRPSVVRLGKRTLATGLPVRHRQPCLTEADCRLPIFEHLAKEPQYGMPIVQANRGQLPARVTPFNIAMARRDYHTTCMFYIGDYLFRRVLTKVEMYTEEMSQFDAVIGTDFSQFADMAVAQRWINCFINKALTAYWQCHHVNVFPNVSWSTPDSYGYSFAGLPHHAVIAINSMGVRRYDASNYLWHRGYEECLRVLQPSLIIRYGERMEREAEDISLYFTNERLEALRHGR